MEGGPGILSRLDRLPLPVSVACGAAVGAAAIFTAWLLLGAGGALAASALTVAGAVVLGWRAEPMLPQPPPAAPHVVEDVPGLLEMVELPGGEFRMGSGRFNRQADSFEKPAHQVALSPFAIARFPVTRELYRSVLEDSPPEWEGLEDNGRLPANHVSWFDAVRFCNALSESRGLEPCYRIEGNEVAWNRRASGYRLPTEAEWEYSARAETRTPWSTGRDPAELGRYAWYGRNAGGRVHRVGEREPNAWGIHDLLGNVWEWCWDRFGPYSPGLVTDPPGAPEGAWRVLRGGAFWYGPEDLRSAYRVWVKPEVSDDGVGFRLARAPRRQHAARETHRAGSAGAAARPPSLAARSGRPRPNVWAGLTSSLVRSPELEASRGSAHWPPSGAGTGKACGRPGKTPCETLCMQCMDSSSARQAIPDSACAGLVEVGRISRPGIGSRWIAGVPVSLESGMGVGTL